MSNRYQQLRKENDLLLSYLTDSYKQLAEIYIKKARGYAVREEDTEVKIKIVLTELTKYDESGIHITTAIPNQSEYIEKNIRLLSKRYKDPDRIKGIIWVCVIIIASILWIAAGKYFAKEVTYLAPKEFHIARVYENNNNMLEITLKWREVENANEYVIYYEVDGNKSAQRTVEGIEFTFTLEKNQTYIFYIYTKNNSVFGSSEVVSVTYNNESSQSFD